MRLIGLVVTMAVLAAGCAPAKAADLQAGLSAYNASKVADAERIYTEVAADDAAKPADRARAYRELGRIAWLIDADAPRALQRLDEAAAIGDEPCQTAQLAARVLREAGRAADAARRAEANLNRCQRPAERDALQMEAVKALLDLGALDQALTAVRLLSPEGQLSDEAARARLGIALQRSDAEAATAAWRDFYWLADADGPQALIALTPRAAIARGLAKSASDTDRLALLDLLIRGGFGREARRYAQASGLAARQPQDPIWRRAVAYWDVRDRIEVTALAVNRDIARGRGGGGRLEEAVRKGTADLMAAAGATGEPRAALIAAYGLFGTAGQTSGYPSAHLGHLVEDRRLPVNQYGKTAEVRFIALENMLANGYESWLWDGSAATGGWTDTGPLIVQVRSGYTGGPLRAASMMAGGPRRAELEARQADRAAEDIAKLKSQPVAYLRGLSDRLQLQVVDQIAAAARAKVGADGDLRRAFLEAYWDAQIDHSIQTHEGRHALDKTLVKGLARLDDSNLEYRAKLSELALSQFPRLALWNIDAETIGGKSPHGLANARILKEYGQWITAHAREIAGYDPALPAMVQIDRLTDAQIRAVARGLDPLAKAASSG